MPSFAYQTIKFKHIIEYIIEIWLLRPPGPLVLYPYSLWQRLASSGPIPSTGLQPPSSPSLTPRLPSKLANSLPPPPSSPSPLYPLSPRDLAPQLAITCLPSTGHNLPPLNWLSPVSPLPSTIPSPARFHLYIALPPLDPLCHLQSAHGPLIPPCLQNWPTVFLPVPHLSHSSTCISLRDHASQLAETCQCLPSTG